MNTRQDHLQHELGNVEQSIETTRSLLDRHAWDTRERAHLRAQLEVLERRARTLHHLLANDA